PASDRLLHGLDVAPDALELVLELDDAPFERGLALRRPRPRRDRARLLLEQPDAAIQGGLGQGRRGGEQGGLARARLAGRRRDGTVGHFLPPFVGGVAARVRGRRSGRAWSGERRSTRAAPARRSPRRARTLAVRTSRFGYTSLKVLPGRVPGGVAGVRS